MKRRSFLWALLGLSAAPAVAMLPKVAAPVASAAEVTSGRAVLNKLFSGELGSYDGMRIVKTMATAEGEITQDEIALRDFYDGMQWSDEQIAQMAAQGRSTLVINRTKPLVDYLIGEGRSWA